MMKLLQIVIPWIQVLFCLQIHAFQDQDDKSIEHAFDSLDRVLNAMDMGLNFMESEQDKMNLDGIIGSRMVEGEYLETLNMAALEVKIIYFG